MATVYQVLEEEAASEQGDYGREAVRSVNAQLLAHASQRGSIHQTTTPHTVYLITPRLLALLLLSW